MKRLLTLVLTVLFVVLAGCTVGPRYVAPVAPVPEAIRGAQLTGAGAAESLADRAWWEILDDAVLVGLIAEALAGNHDLRLAAWRVEEARAAAGIARAERLPAVGGGAGWSRGRQSEALFPGGETTGLYDVGVGIAWEIDLWGRLRHLDEAARARLLATAEARRGIQLSLISEVATSYFRLRALDRQLEIARGSAGAFAETRNLFDRRLAAGLASGLETASAQASLSGAAAAVPALERQIAAEENRLSFLLGRTPGDVPRGAALEEQLLPPAVPAGLPADLLRRRPDLRQAEQELVAANAEVGVATAELFPTLRLTGAYGGLAPEVSDLFGAGRAWSIGGGLLTPIVQGRRLQDQRAAAVARWEQAKVRHEAAVTSAFAEVSTALAAYQDLARVEAEEAAAVAAHRETVKIASSRYFSGLADYFEVLDAQRRLFPAETALAQTRFDRLATLVELYRALGGGWNDADDARPGGQRSAEAAGL